jgi:xanthine dehydrogenase accessory factor
MKQSSLSILALLLAAGRGSRLGETSSKPLTSWRGRSLVARSLEPYLEWLNFSRVSVDLRIVLGFQGEQVAEHLSKSVTERLNLIQNSDWQTGMSSSIRCGLQVAKERSFDGVLIGLADMPWISPAVLEKLATELTPNSIVCPVYDGKRGHPILLGSALFCEMEDLSGDVGARSLLKRYPERIKLVEVQEPGVLEDIDQLSDCPSPLPRVLIRGAGDLATGVAHRLKQSGFEVAMLELACPRMLRSKVSFAQAVYEPGGEVIIEGVAARVFSELPRYWGGAIPVVIDPDGRSLEQNSQFEVLVDARMLKSQVERSVAHKTLIGIGPGFKVGVNADAIVETQRGHELGKVLHSGSAQADSGVPGEIAGETWKRLVRSPAAGQIEHQRQLGELVKEGESIGTVDGIPIVTHMAGCLRGLMRSGLTVTKDEKIADIDPRSQVGINSISDKARAVAGGVLEAILNSQFNQA